MCMNSSRIKGFSLVELIFFIVVVGVGVAGIMLVSNTVVKSSADPLVRKQTVAVAESLLEEILLKEYAKPVDSPVVGFGGGGARNLYDCVDDFNGYTTSGGIVDVSGLAVSGLSNYDVSPAVSVTTVMLGPISVKRVVVSVTGPQGAISIAGYRGNY